MWYDGCDFGICGDVINWCIDVVVEDEIILGLGKGDDSFFV